MCSQNVQDCVKFYSDRFYISQQNWPVSRRPKSGGEYNREEGSLFSSWFALNVHLGHFIATLHNGIFIAFLPLERKCGNIHRQARTCSFLRVWELDHDFGLRTYIFWERGFTYLGGKIFSFLKNWEMSFRGGRIGMVINMKHEVRTKF